MKYLVIFLMLAATVFGGLDAFDGKVINVANPTANKDAANKLYVDELPTRTGTDTWGSGSNFTWTFATAGTDPVFDFSSALISLTGNFDVNLLINSVELGKASTDNYWFGDTETMGTAGATLSGATDNIGIGSDALKSLTSGDRNIAIGSNALDAVTIASDLIAIGYNALTNATTTAENDIAIGIGAGSSITVGDRNILIGTDAGAALTNQNSSVAIGHSALSLQEGGINIGIGTEACQRGGGSFTKNIGIGLRACKAVNGATGDWNIGIGEDTLSSLDGGQSNIAIGQDALADVIDGSFNIALGEFAGKDITDGDRNIAIGVEAAANLETGDNNICLGHESAELLITGDDNIIIGQRAYDNATGGSNNIAIGEDSLGTATSVSNLIAIGQNTLTAVTDTAANDIAIGTGAGALLTTGARNLLIGTDTGAALTAADDNNIMLGYLAGKYETGSNSLYIDALDRTDEATAKTNSLIYGTFDADPNNQTLAVNAALSALSFTVDDLTETRVVFAGAGGVLSDDSDFTFVDDTLFATNIISGGITIFDVTPVLVFKDSNNTGAASIGFIEWRDSANTRLGFLGNSTNQNDDLLWKNEFSGGHIKIETTGAGEFQIFADTVLNNNSITGIDDLTASGLITTAELLLNLSATQQYQFSLDEEGNSLSICNLDDTIDLTNIRFYPPSKDGFIGFQFRANAIIGDTGDNERLTIQVHAGDAASINTGKSGSGTARALVLGANSNANLTLNVNGTTTASGGGVGEGITSFTLTSGDMELTDGDLEIPSGDLLVGKNMRIVGSSLLGDNTSAVTTINRAYDLPTNFGPTGHLVTAAGGDGELTYTDPATLSVALAAAVTVADESGDTTCFPAFFTDATGGLPVKTDADGLTYNSLTKSLTLGGDLDVTSIGTFGEVNIGSAGHSGTLLAVGTSDTGTQDFSGIVGILSDISNPTSSANKSGLEIQPYWTDESDGRIGAFIKPIIDGWGSAGNAWGLFGGVDSVADVAGMSIEMFGLDFEARHTANVTKTGLGNRFYSIYGLRAIGNFGFTGKAISNQIIATGYGGLLEVRLDGNHDSSVADGNAYGLYVFTNDLGINSTDGGHDVNVYGVLIDACASKAFDGGGGGDLISWGLVELKGRNNALAGNTRIGSLGIPTSLFHVGDGTNELRVSATGDLSFGGGGGFIEGHMTIPAVDIVVDTSGTTDPVEVADDGTGVPDAGDGWASVYQNEVTFAVSDLHYQTVTIAGTYKVIWDQSPRTAAGGGTVIHGGIMIDGVAVRDNGEGHAHIFNANDNIQINGIGVVDCPNGNEEISLWISNNAGFKTIIEHGNMNVQLIGGT